MESLKCPSCGAHLDVDETEKFLTCEYCDSKFPNQYYDPDAYYEKEDEEMTDEDIADICTDYVVELGFEMEAENFSSSVFGNPLDGGEKYSKALKNFKIQRDEEDVYFVYDSTVFGGGERGFAFCTTGIYYVDDKEIFGGTARFMTWHEFLDNDVTFEDGNLFFGENAEFIVGDSGDDIVDYLMEIHSKAGEDVYGE